MHGTVISLFDVSRNWSSPFEKYGLEVVPLDLKRGHDLRTYGPDKILALAKKHPVIRGILAAPPCTDFTLSGAKHWKKKDQAGTTEGSIDLVKVVLRFVTYLKPDFWALENPVGRLPSLIPDLLGQCQFSFDPWEFAGWTNPSKEDLAQLQALRLKNGYGSYTKADEALVRRVNCYSKKTQLWGSFMFPRRAPIPDVRMNKYGSWLMNYGGKSEQTKTIRSETPAGFSEAFASAQMRAYVVRHFTDEVPQLFNI